MRNDLNILWVDDSENWYETKVQEIEMELKEKGWLCNFEYESDVTKIMDIFEKEEAGFRKYDLYFLDYNLSHEQWNGSHIIKEIKNKRVYADILFYSQNDIDEITESIKEDYQNFEGVYFEQREYFDAKAHSLIEKNIRKLLSIKNIRGILMEHTAENDFIMKSYIKDSYNTLDEGQQKVLHDCIMTLVNKNIAEISNFQKKKEEGIKNISKALKLPNYILNLSDRYTILQKVIELQGKEVNQIEKYEEDVIKKRNTLAHRKLELCHEQKNVIDFDTKNAYDTYIKTKEFKNAISMEDWEQLRKKIYEYGKAFDELWESL